MSPFLFDIYIDDLIVSMNKKYHCWGYADDIVIICKSFGELLKAIEEIEAWCSLNKMELNKNKCGIL